MGYTEALLILAGMAAFIAVLSPYIVLRSKSAYTQATISAARILFYASGFFILASILWASGISLAVRSLNITVVLAMLLSVIALAVFSFRLRPVLVGLAGGAFSMIFAAGFALGLLLSGLLDDISPKEAEIGDSMYCRKSGYGFVTSDSGTNIKAFKRYFFIDRKILDISFSDIYPESNRQPEGSFEAETLARCERSFPPGP